MAQMASCEKWLKRLRRLEYLRSLPNCCKIIEKKHDKIKTFGIGNNYKKDFWQGFIRQLISSRHLIINIKKFGCLQITKSGLKILKDDKYFNYKEIIFKAAKTIKKNYCQV